MDVQIFNFLRKSRGSNSDSFLPFEGVQITKILKEITNDMTGVGVTVTGLRSAAESHVDMIGYDKQSENIQKALSYTEGHCESIAKLFYKRNGSQSIMSAWTTYANKLMNIDDADDGVTAIDEKIVESINKSQERWVKGVQSILHKATKQYQANTVSPAKAVDPEICNHSGKKRKSKTDWSANEDEELRKLIRIYGEGKWKDCLDNSPILQERYKMVSGECA